MAIAVSQVLGLLAGALILLLGVFVVKAKPRSPLHRLFCAFAVADGLSTAMFSLAYIPSTLALQLHALLLYYHAFFVFIALLLIFALLFPRPILPPGWRRPTVAAIVVVTGGVMAWHALDPYAFWTGTETASGLVLASARGGRITVSVWLVILAGIALRLTHLFLKEPSPSHRSQASFVLGGMALGYTPYATTTFAQVLSRGTSATLGHPDGTVGALYACTGLVVATLVYALARILGDRRQDAARERRILLRCFASVLLLTIPAFLFPGATLDTFLQMAGLVAWPILLAYAIARYEVLDIGPTVRRTATYSLAMTVLAVAFFVAEALLENALQATFAGALGVSIVAVLVAGLATALVFAPISTAAKRIANRVAPEVAGEARRARQREIYRHGLEAVLADGAVSVSENRVLTSLRETLGITADDHHQMLAEIEGRYPAARRGMHA